jgi:hypothetical protein
LQVSSVHRSAWSALRSRRTARHRDQPQPLTVLNLRLVVSARELGVPPRCLKRGSALLGRTHPLVDAIEAADPSAAEAATSVHVAAAAVAALDNLKNR